MNKYNGKMRFYPECNRGRLVHTYTLSYEYERLCLWWVCECGSTLHTLLRPHSFSLQKSQVSSISILLWPMYVSLVLDAWARRGMMGKHQPLYALCWMDARKRAILLVEYTLEVLISMSAAAATVRTACKKQQNERKKSPSNGICSAQQICIKTSSS